VPSIAPTAADLMNVEVEVSMTADSSPTDEQEDIFKQTVADQIGVELTSLKNFAITVVVTDDAVTVRRHRQLLGKMYELIVSFYIKIEVTETAYKNATDFIAAVEEKLMNGTFETAVESATGIAVDVDESSVSMTLISRTRSPTSSSKKKNDDDGFNHEGFFYFLGGICVVFIWIGCLGFNCRYKSRELKVMPDSKYRVAADDEEPQPLHRRG